jgi:hypothetical protein
MPWDPHARAPVSILQLRLIFDRLLLSRPSVLLRLSPICSETSFFTNTLCDFLSSLSPSLCSNNHPSWQIKVSVLTCSQRNIRRSSLAVTLCLTVPGCLALHHSSGSTPRLPIQAFQFTHTTHHYAICIYFIVRTPSSKLSVRTSCNAPTCDHLCCRN